MKYQSSSYFVHISTIAVCNALFLCSSLPSEGFPGSSVVKNLPASAGDTRDAGSIPGLGRSPGKEIATYSSVPAVINPWTEEPGGLQSMGSPRVGHN